MKMEKCIIILCTCEPEVKAEFMIMIMIEILDFFFSDMFMSSQFSPRTIDTLNKMVETGPSRRKEDYKWRKDMQE